MKINNNANIEWTEKVESTSSVRNPLGLWNHLNIQVDYVPGITSVTKRIRYYSLWAWYYENLFEDRIINQKNFERLFILTCLAHHKGNYKHESFKDIHNKERFKDNWNSIDKFKLDKKDFVISGQGYSYYNAQLTKLRCYWTDQLNQMHKSPINKALSNIFSMVDEDFLKQKQFTRKEILENLSNFCICQKYPDEIEVMTKLFFGFINNKGDEWYIDEESYKQFIENGKIDFEFKGFEVDTEEIILSNAPKIQEMNQRRRNTLFLFLKIIHETNPQKSEMHKAIWDATYFKQNKYSKEDIEFNGLNKVMKFWELLQLNVYYVYTVEKVFDVVQESIFDENGIFKDKILTSLNQEKILKTLTDISKRTVEKNTRIQDIINAIQSNYAKEKGLKTTINESIIYDNISKTDELEEILSNSFIMLTFLKRKFNSIDKEVIGQARISEKGIDIKDKLKIDQLFEYMDQNENKGIMDFLNYLIQSVIERHLYEANVRMSRNRTKIWLFVEEDSRLYFSKNDLIYIKPRDNRWTSIMSLMEDIEMIKVEKKISLTDKGKKWLQQAKLI